MRQACVYLSTQALMHNLQRVREAAPTSSILAMVKADAYGHGLAFALNALQDADALGVAFFTEALDIRALGNTKPIVLIEGAFSPEEWLEAHQINAQCVIHQDCQLQWALDHVLPNVTIWLKINTGMNRLGFSPEKALVIANKLRLAGYDLILTMHFANADEESHPLNQQQRDTFLTLKEKLDPIKASLCNSAALMQWSDMQLDWVRPGIMLYGSSPFVNHSAAKLNLKPVMTLTTHLIAKHEIPANVFVGYGSQFKTSRPTRLGIVAIGYGDGYPRVIETGSVSIQGRCVPIVGRVSMDMLAVDLTDLTTIPPSGTDVTLWGNGLDVDAVARTAGSISYELFTRLSKRPIRHIID